MTRISQFVIYFVLTAGFVGCGWFAPEPLPELEAGFEYLFDGQSLDGWQAEDQLTLFGVSRGELRGESGALVLDQPVGNFELRFELKIDRKATAGLLFRGAAQYSAGYLLLLSSEDDTTSGLYEAGKGGLLAPLNSSSTGAAELEAGAWQRVEISARGANINIKINDLEVISVLGARALNGVMVLSVDGEAGSARWRHIRMKRAPEHRWDRQTLVDRRAWQGVGGSGIAVGENSINFGGAAGSTLRSKRRFGDFALRFTLPLCELATLIDIRRDENGDGVVAALTGQAVTISLREPDAEEPLILASFDRVAAIDQAEVLITAVGDQLSVSVDGKQVVQRAGLNMASQGVFQIRTAGCAATTTLSDLAWIDLSRDSSEPKFYETVAVPPAPILTAADELATFKLAPGFRAELVAAEPLVGDPVAMAWDADGRLYVVEMRGFMQDAYGSGEDQPVGRVVVLEDTNNDGRMDKGSVFLEGLVLPRAVAVVNEGVLIGEPPHLWLCPKHNPLKCESKVRVGDYAADHEQSNPEHLENGLLQGLDNWLYNAKSDRRMRLLNGKLETQTTQFRGQWGIAQDDRGRLYYNNNSVWLLGDYFPAAPLLREYLDLPQVSGLSRQIAKDDEVFSIRVNPGVNRAYVDGTLRPDGRLEKVTAISGLTVMRGDAFPPPYAGNIFIPEPGANAVGQFRPVENGLQVSAEHITWPDEQWGEREFMASTDERFRPVDAKVGPDGALYIIDMYRGIIQDVTYLSDSLREQAFRRGLDAPVGLGRIWRITHEATPRRAVAKMSGLSVPELIGMLDSTNGWQRDTAQRLLLNRRDGLKSLRIRAWGGNGLGAVHAVWALAGRGELSAEDVLQVVNAGDVESSIQALRAGGGLLALSELQKLLVATIAEKPAVLRELILALRFHHDQPITAGLLAAQAAQWLANPPNGSTPFILNAIVAASSESELAVLDQLSNHRLSASESAADFYAQLTRRAYLTLRPDIRSESAAPAKLKALLTLASNQADWIQVAMLGSLSPLRLQNGFKPAVFDAAPPIFTDTAVDESSPLWKARLSARRAFTWPGDELAMGLEPLGPRQMAMMQKGEQFYVNCGACHGSNGAGVTGLAPPLANSEWVTGAPEWLARIILQGLSGPITVNGKAYSGVMPPHNRHAGLNDETLAGLMTYLRRSWGNTAAAVDAETVAAIRAASAGRTAPWTVAELEQVPVDRGYAQYEGVYKVSFMKLTVSEQDGDLMLKVPMYGTSALAPMDEEHLFSVRNGDMAAVIRFVFGDDGAVNQLRLKQGTNDLLAERIE